MTTIRASFEAPIAAPAACVYNCLADYVNHHPHFLPTAFSAMQVTQGGYGAGTELQVKLKVSGHARVYRTRVSEPEPGWVLRETDLDLGTETTFTLTPHDGGVLVRIDTVYQRGGLAGLMEQIVAPYLLRSLYADKLQRLDRYARQQKAITALAQPA